MKFYGSSLQGTMEAYFPDMCRMFGLPEANTLDGEPTDFEWALRLQGEPVTIYNWGNGPSCGFTIPTKEIMTFQIGGYSEKAVTELINRMEMKDPVYAKITSESSDTTHIIRKL